MKKIVICIVFALLSLSLFAADEIIPSNEKKDVVLVASWIWKTNDNVKSFRFKINNDDPTYWDHVVDGDVTSYSIRGVKEGEVYTMYIQQTYDGENWSESAVSTITVNNASMSRISREEA